MTDFSLQIVKRAAMMAIAMALTSIAPAEASSFCVAVTGLPTECIYDDAVECSRRAAQLAGVCEANPSDLITTQGSARYCIVGQQHEAECSYSDRNTCNSAAESLGGACIENYNAENQVNPFAAAPKKRTDTDIQANPFAAEPNKAY